MILGIESSCDESAVSLFDPSSGRYQDLIYSQLETHQAFGGVVPDKASRLHAEILPRLLAQIDLSAVSEIAVTTGPGLASCLAMGITAAKTLSMGLNRPYYALNHLKGHAYSPFIQAHRQDPVGFDLTHYLPHLGLIVSGGNTLLFYLKAPGSFELIAQTQDDAAGEALDKGARLLGMPYPGGPLMEHAGRSGDPQRYDFPRAFGDAQEMKFSFSGLKTSLRYLIQKMTPEALERAQADLCASYQRAVVDALIHKTQQALELYPLRSLGLSGGVSRNETLRSAFASLAQSQSIRCLKALPEHTGDNAAMIAFAHFMERDLKAPAGLNEGFHPRLSLIETRY